MAQYTSNTATRTLPVDIPLLDAVDAAAEAGWSFEKLLSSYTGACIRAYDASDKSGSSQDIGFDASGVLDTTALESFAGSGDAWMEPYDQVSGTLLTTATPPKIVSSGTTITNTGGDIAAEFTGGQRIEMGSAPSSTYSFYVSGDSNGALNTGVLAGNFSNNDFRARTDFGTLNYWSNAGSSAISMESIGQQHTIIAVFTSLSSTIAYSDEVPRSFDVNAISNPLRIGNRSDGSKPWGSTIKTTIVWQSALSFADRRAIALNRGMI